ncbi:MAG: transporter substrate-binding domain-containing protein [Planctomycetota bacterium]|nr:transporter substrate-binding domain-containing protein [Planctomycetota bacterium]
MKKVFSIAFLEVVGAMLVMLFVAGFLVFLFERRKNPSDFGGHWLKGSASGIWWAAVTMTTVGYGDKAPKTPAGRIVAVIWMFSAILLISAFTASVTSALTVTELESIVDGPSDLRRVRVATVSGSTSEDYLKDRFIPRSSFETVREALDELRERRVDAVVYDGAMLKFLAFNEYAGTVQVLPRIFERQDYAFGVQSDSPLREKLNQAILQVINRPEWDDRLKRYLGQ